MGRLDRKQISDLQASGLYQVLMEMRKGQITGKERDRERQSERNVWAFDSVLTPFGEQSTWGGMHHHNPSYFEGAEVGGPRLGRLAEHWSGNMYNHFERQWLIGFHRLPIRSARSERALVHRRCYNSILAVMVSPFRGVCSSPAHWKWKLISSQNTSDTTRPEVRASTEARVVLRRPSLPGCQ